MNGRAAAVVIGLALGAVVVAILAHRRAEAAYDLAIGHALDRTRHPRPAAAEDGEGPGRM